MVKKVRRSIRQYLEKRGTPMPKPRTISGKKKRKASKKKENACKYSLTDVSFWMKYDNDHLVIFWFFPLMPLAFKIVL